MSQVTTPQVLTPFGGGFPKRRLPPPPSWKPPPLPSEDEHQNLLNVPGHRRAVSQERSRSPSPLPRNQNPTVSPIESKIKIEPKVTANLPHNKLEDTVNNKSNNVINNGLESEATEKDVETITNRIKLRTRRNSLIKTLTRVEPYLLVASAGPEDGVTSQRLAELGVSCVTQTSIGSNGSIKTLFPDGMDVTNITIGESDAKQNFNLFDGFADKVEKVWREKGVILVLSDESGVREERDGSAAALCAAYLIKAKGLTLRSSLEAIKRPEVHPCSSLKLLLYDYERHCHGNNQIWKFSKEWLVQITKKLARNWLPIVFSILVFIIIIQAFYQVADVGSYNDPFIDDPKLPCM